jgi:hypothetical protein
MLTKKKPGQDCRRATAENCAMVSAIFGALADFAEPAEQKLKAVIRAGKIAEDFLAAASIGTSPPKRDGEILCGDRSDGERALSDRAA